MILITRPKSDAIKLQKQLTAESIQSEIEPLNSFKFIKRDIKLSKESIYICASQRAVEALVKFRNQNINLKVVAIGKKVGMKLHEHSFQNILYVALDSNGLVKWIRRKNNILTEYIYLSGSVTNKEFINQLRRFNINYKRKIIYQTLNKKSFSEKTLRKIKQNKFTSILFYSKKSVQVYFSLMRKNKIENKFKNQKFFALSERIAKEVKKQGIQKSVIKIPKRPDNISMINLLVSCKKLI